MNENILKNFLRKKVILTIGHETGRHRKVHLIFNCEILFVDDKTIEILDKYANVFCYPITEVIGLKPIQEEVHHD